MMFIHPSTHEIPDSPAAQSHFIMPGGLQSSREISHYAEVFRLADRARLLTRPDLAVARMTLLARLHGIG